MSTPEIPQEQPYTLADFEAELVAAPRYTPTQFAIRWMQNMHARPNEIPDSEWQAILKQRQAVLRRQIISAFARSTDEQGNLIETSDEVKIISRVGLLSLLASFEPMDHAQRGLALSTGDDFVPLLMEKALADNWAYDQEKKRKQLQREVLQDPLTGLANLKGSKDIAERLLGGIEEGKYMGGAILYLDLDRFKDANDMFGHQKGDELLTGVAKVLSSGVRSEAGDVVTRGTVKDAPESDRAEEAGRVGGDEFVLFIAYRSGPSRAHPSRNVEDKEVSLEERTTRIADRLEERIRDFLVSETGGRIPDIGVSIGAVIVTPETKVEDIKKLIARSDKLMYKMKRRKRNERNAASGGSELVTSEE